MKITCALLLILNTYLLPMNGENPSGIVGQWITPENKSIIQIEFKGGDYTGRILRINPSLYVNGAVPKDIHNKEPALRSRSMEGLTVLSGFTYNQSKKRWDIKHVYEPERGKYLEGYITLDEQNELSMRGHIPGKKLLGKTEVWRRVEAIPPF